MLAALLTTLLFSISAICGQRSARQIGGVEANFWRICTAAGFLALWANLFGTKTNGEALPIFALSGLLGIGLGDTGYFQALTRLGTRRTVLISQCLTAPAAALIEWLWLGTKLSWGQMLFIAVILTGIVVAMAP
ncbi:MAG: EamA family transporter, partial [Limisphaerales bacterium]